MPACRCPERCHARCARRHQRRHPQACNSAAAALGRTGAALRGTPGASVSAMRADQHERAIGTARSCAKCAGQAQRLAGLTRENQGYSDGQEAPHGGALGVTALERPSKLKRLVWSRPRAKLRIGRVRGLRSKDSSAVAQGKIDSQSSQSSRTARRIRPTRSSLPEQRLHRFQATLPFWWCVLGLEVCRPKRAGRPRKQPPQLASTADLVVSGRQRHSTNSARQLPQVPATSAQLQ